jgi:hypothetical protein
MYAEADPGFQVKGGAIKKIAPSGGRRENFWDISCEKSRFYAKKSFFFQLRREARKLLGVFRVKNHDFTPKNHFFFQLRREARKLFGVFRVKNHDFTPKNHIFSNFPGSAPGM